MLHSNLTRAKTTTARRPGALPILLLVAALSACGGNQQQTPATGSAAVAEGFISAFYSWHPSELRALLAGAELVAGSDADRALYYQGWAQAANYQIQTRRPCVALANEPTPTNLETSGAIESTGEQWVCRITVTDNFGKTLGYTATDTFTLTVADNKITAVTFEGDDPPIFAQLQQWIATERPEVMSGPCKDLFNGGTTPGDCARAVVAAAKEFVAR